MSIFDGDWHCYIESASNPPVLELQDPFHLVVNGNGELQEGSTHGAINIEGRVDEALQRIVISENHPELGLIRFEGGVVFDNVVASEQRFMACGRMVLQVGPSEDQEQGTWVITKP